MDVIFPDAGLLPILVKIVGTGLIYNLYINDISPSVDSVKDDFERANWSGYNPIFVPADDFSLRIVTTDIGKFQADPIMFANPSPADVQVYGYFVTDASDTDIVAAARFDLAPVTIVRGSLYPVLPLLGVLSGLQG